MWKLGVMQNIPQTPEPVTGNRRDPSTSPVKPAYKYNCAAVWVKCGVSAGLHSYLLVLFVCQLTWPYLVVGIVVWKFPLSQAVVKRLDSCFPVGKFSSWTEPVLVTWIPVFLWGNFWLDWTCIGHLDSCFPMGKFLIRLNLCWLPGFLFSPGEISDWTEPVLVTWIPVFQLDWTCVGHLDSCFPIPLTAAPPPPPQLLAYFQDYENCHLFTFWCVPCSWKRGSSTFEEVGWGLHCVVWFSSSFYDILVKLKYCCY